MTPPALLPRASAVRPLAPASSSPLRARVVAAARTPLAPPRTARPVSLLCTPRRNVDTAAAGGADTKSYWWPWGDEDPPKYVEEGIVETHRRFVRESREAVAALKAAAADACRALVDNFGDIRSLKTVYDVEDDHIDMPFGVLVACIGCYQLWKLDPSTFLDVVLGYAFYRLSVLGSHVRRQGFSNDLFGQLKFVIVIIMAVKDFRKNLALIDAIRTPVYAFYVISFLQDISGQKKYSKYYLAVVIELLKTEEGRGKLVSCF
ncbi:hypothetical protein VPH35_090991 [Triticum aestivum]|uniref:Uncharacterized protein n=1 Tax=Triticum turgidum subsp. durum TaxID=4567 RepID=A0A9R0XC63_TRITD|nr:uncharacterized protein LOC123116438 [Triticum aestivum]VAI33994.1 unnamed protein product [Triticum turgidum subsp. durum]